MHSTDNGITDTGLDLSAAIRIRTARGLIGITNSSSSTSSLSASSSSSSATSIIQQQALKNCANCGKKITERFLLKAIDLFWHEDCLKCGCCDCRLGEVGSTLYTKANLILCKRDYLRLFGTTGSCAACNKIIPAFEMVMRAKNNVYHLECFACQQCNHRFCVGDRFYLCENKILCEYDYEERLVFANMANNPSSLAHIRRQVSNLQTAITAELLPPFPKNIVRTLINNGRQQVQHYNNNNSALSPVITLSSSYNNEKHLDERQPRPPTRGSIRDDGSSGYGSPDSETFDTPLPPPPPQ